MNLMSASLHDGFGSLASLLDSGPFASGWSDASTVGCGVSPAEGDGDSFMGKSCAQSRPDNRLVSTWHTATGVSPCPCDRWCEASGCSTVNRVPDTLGTISQPQGLRPKVVSFRPHVEVFVYNCDGCIESCVPRIQQLRNDPHIGVAGEWHATFDDPASIPVDDPFGSSAFWAFWHHCWKLHSESPVGSDSSDSRYGTEGFDPRRLPEQCPDAPSILLRNENDPAPALQDHPVQDPIDFDPTLDDEPDSDNDLGVSFFRWQDIAEVVDVFQFSSATNVPFITFGLRDHPLGRRDFASPDLSPSRLRNLIWQLWQDEAHQFDDLVIHFVRPQPVEELDCPGVIVLIVEICHDRTPPASSPVLALTCDRYNRLIDSPRAVYVPQAADAAGLYPHLSLSHLCTPGGFRQCQLYIAGRLIGPGVIPIPPGVTIKLTISAKLKIFAQAASWFPDLERFAARVRELVRSGVYTHVLQVHRHQMADISIQFQIADVFQPPALKATIERHCGHAIGAVFPIIDRVLNTAYVDPCARCHVMALDDASRDMSAFIVVTQLMLPDGSTSHKGHRMCLSGEFSQVEALHRALCVDLHLDPDWCYQIECQGHPVVHLHTVSHTTVLTHTVHQQPEGAEDHPMPVLHGDDEIADSDGASDGLSESVSLLQLGWSCKKTIVLQHNYPPLRLDIPVGTEDVERCEIATRIASRFYSALGWLDRKHFPSLPDTDIVEILIDLQRPPGHVDVFLDVVFIPDIEPVHLQSRLLRLPLFCDGRRVIAELFLQLGIDESMVESFLVEESPWFLDTSGSMADGDYCKVIVTHDPFLDNASHEFYGKPDVPGIPSLATYLVDLGPVTRRIDIVGPHDPQLVIDQWQVFSEQTLPLRHFRVPWDPSHLEFCRDLFILAECQPLKEQITVLLWLAISDEKQVWQTCSLQADDLGKAIGCRFPESARFQCLINGCDARTYTADAVSGSCVFCDAAVPLGSLPRFPFTDGMNKLIDWISDDCLTQCPASHAASRVKGDAPCPCDRWCADPGSSDPGHDTSTRTPVAASTRAVPILLDAVIPDRSTLPPCSAVPVSLLHSADLSTSLSQMQVVLCPDLPEGLTVHRSTAIEFLKCNPCKGVAQADFLRHELYIDGSATAAHCSWALVHVHRFADGTRSFDGLLADSVTLDPNDAHWIGAQALDNIAAELSAMCVAYSYALTLCGPVCICPDLQFGHDLVRRQVTNKDNMRLAKLCTALGRLQHVPIEEVRAHKGDPYNELADRVAKWAGSQALTFGSFDWSSLHSVASCPADLDWSWLPTTGPAFQQTLPELDDVGCLHVVPATHRIEADSACRAQVHLDEVLKVQFKIATANVQSVREHSTGAGRRCSATTNRLDQQWNRSQIDIVGVQEARTPQGQDTSQHYKIFCSGVDVSHGSAHFGCEIWLRKQAVVATSKEGSAVTLGDCKIVVKVADPRRLVLMLSHGTFELVIASLHAPCLSSSNSLEDIAKWWDVTADLLSHQHLDRCVVCIDANAPLGQEALPLVGGFGAEPENSQSELFHKFLELTQLAVPCTFADVHEGKVGTWKHPKGMMCRRDYVLLALPMQPWAAKSFVMDDFDRARAHVDHLPSVLCLQGWLPGSPAPGKIRWDAVKFRDPVICETFRNALATLPLPAWNVHADDHCRIWESQVLKLAAQFFAKDDHHPRSKPRPVLEPSTLNLIQFKRHALSLARGAHGEQYEDYKAILRDVEKQVRAQVARDQRAWYDELISQVQHSGELHDSAHMFKLLRRLGSRKYKSPRRPLPMLQKDDGSFTSSVEEMQAVFREQFAKLEGGIQKTYEALATDHHCHDLLPADQVDPGMIFSPWDIAQAISKMKRGKVPGRNGITTEILKCAGDVAASQMVPLLMKCTLHQFEPLSWKGGTLVPLFKGKGKVDCPASYRSIFISDTTCKTFHSCLRTRLMRAWESSMCTLQFGGRPGFGTDVAHHCAHAFLSWSRHSGTPAALIFLDLTAAFYSVLRQGLFQHDICDLHLCYAFKTLGITPDELHEVVDTVASEAAVEGVSQHCDLVLKGLFEATHFSIDGLPGVTHTSKGTRPGDPIADLLFNMTMRLIQRSVQKKLEAYQLCDLTLECSSPNVLEVPELPAQGYAAVAYVDDVVIMAHAPSNEQVRHMTQLIVSTYYDEARHRGLWMNFEPKKTEAIFQPAGKGTRSFKDHWFRQMHGRLPIITESSLHHLHLVHKYRHLGTQIQHGADIAADSREKSAFARQAWGPLARSFFAKRNVSLQAKVPVFRSLVLSRLLYNCHVWSWWRDSPAKAWSNTVRTMVISMLGYLGRGVKPYQLSTSDLCALAGFLAPEHQIHVHRLMYIKRLIIKGPSLLWAYLWRNTSDRAWLKQLLASFQWFRVHFPGHLPLQPDCSIQDWISFVAIDAKWKGRVKQAAKAATYHFKLQAEGLVWQMSMLYRMETVECYVPPPTPAHAGQWICETCDLPFKSRRALAMHASKVHGYIRRSKYFIDGDVCHSCLKKYHTVARAVTHLDHNPRCAALLDACFGPLSEAEVAASSELLKEQANELKQAGWQSTKAFCPVTRIPGPSLPPVGSLGAFVMRAKWDARREPGTGHHQLRGYVRGDVNDGRLEPVQRNSQAVSFVMNTYGGKIEGLMGCATEYGLSFLCAQVQVRSLFFVHFFSGFRRQGDLQHWLEDEIVGNGYHIYCLSVDICLCRSNFDLTAKHALDFWVGKAKDGYVIGGGGGPPCETMSAARFTGPGPQPVRSGGCFWGKPGNSRRQNKQVEIGSRLLMFILAFLQEMAVAGLCGFLEHPAFPTWLLQRDPPSIWAMAQIKAMAKLACVRISTIDQCSFGCVAMKPTTFLMVRLPGLQNLLTKPGLRGRCVHPRGFHLALAGKDKDGNFNTAKAKIYPPKLNKALSEGLRDFADLLWANRTEPQVLPEELTALQTFEFVETDVVQPDFQA